MIMTHTIRHDTTAIGYFLFDLCVILWYMLPMWTVFVAHHIVAL